MSEQLIATPSVFGENGNFMLERELGSGGMGGVYMGRDKMLDRPVALKVMLKEYGDDADFVEKFKKEAQAAARLIHPNIVQVYSYGIFNGMPYMALELATGGSLFSLMNVHPGKTDITRVIKICQQTAMALQCASDQGFVHGDIKPENILLDANGNAKLVDFGLAAMQKDTDEIWGTPYYISPEKVKKEPIDFRADMYSLGATLYHALTGVAPFEGDDMIAVIKKRFEGAPMTPSSLREDITPAVDKLVMRMLELEPENRFPSFEALLEAFKEVLTSGLTKESAPAATEEKKPAVKASSSTVTSKRTVRGRRMALKRPGASSVIKKKIEGAEGDEGAADEDGVNKSESEDDEDEEGGSSNLAVKVIGVVVGVILLIGGVIGGLVWFQIADKNSRTEEEQRQISDGTSKARSAVTDTMTSANKFADEFDAFALKAIEEVEKPTQELKKILPPEHGALLKPGPSKELLDAIAATNEMVAVAAPAAAPAGTNAAPAAAAATAASNAAPAKASAPAATNAAPAKAAAPAKNAAPAKEEAAAPAAPPPQVVIAMNELWDRAYGCQASAVRIRHSVRKLLKKGAEAEALTEITRENMEKLAEISRTLVEMLDGIKTSKDVENVRKGITFIRSKGEKTVEQTVKRLRIEKLEADRKAKQEATAAAEKERQEQEAAERKEKVEAETKEVTDKFDTIVAAGSIRQLDWKNAIRQLETLKSELKMPESQIAADLQLKKIKDMKLVHDVFVKSIRDHVFRGKLKGAKVTSVNEREMNLDRGKQKAKITWQKFYKNYPGNLNELINIYIIKGRENAKPKLNLKDWADAMTGAALTLNLVCAETNGAVDKAKMMINEVAKQFPDRVKQLKEIFPDVELKTEEE